MAKIVEKRMASEAPEDEPTAKRRRLQDELAAAKLPPELLDSATRKTTNKVSAREAVAAVYIDDVIADRRAAGGLRQMLDTYIPPPVYRSAHVTVTIPGGYYSYDAIDDDHIPIQVAEFLDILKPSVGRTRSKYDYVEIDWGADAEWDYSETEIKKTAADWKDKEPIGSEWHDEISVAAHGFEAYRYFLAHYHDADRDEKTEKILKGTT
jgi:hypothetical protein